ncbi:hypothetical protein [Roseateles violae]|uniref:YtxH-like protein n=1 Tax=Roseateles violae TaxID=3058042 RepID=A0ABT8E0D6_9BURK|nr:hypothetical protein [Pelomonas sp. PFR6]MDN3923326.1 hypothetical protein [Pelomonas sp. PFR6]
MRDQIIRAIATAATGAMVGWGGNAAVTALQLSPRVDAIERALVRIESRLDAQNRGQEPRK